MPGSCGCGGACAPSVESNQTGSSHQQRQKLVEPNSVSGRGHGLRTKVRGSLGTSPQGRSELGLRAAARDCDSQ